MRLTRPQSPVPSRSGASHLDFPLEIASEAFNPANFFAARPSSCTGFAAANAGLEVAHGRVWRRQRRRWRRLWSRRLLRRRRARRRRTRRRRRRRGRWRRGRARRRWGQLQEARVGLERGAELDEWPVLLVAGLEGSSKPSAPARNAICRLRGLPPELRFSRRPSWVHGDYAALADISGASGTVGGVNNAFLHRSASGHRREPDFLDSCPHPEAAPEKSWMAKGNEVR